MITGKSYYFIKNNNRPYWYLNIYKLLLFIEKITILVVINIIILNNYINKNKRI